MGRIDAKSYRGYDRRRSVAEVEPLEPVQLVRECAKLSPAEEQEMAEEGIAKDAAEWPEY